MSLGAAFRAAVLASCLGLAGCAFLQQPVPATVPDNSAAEVTALLEQFDRLAEGAADEQRREYVAAQAAFDANATDFSRLRLALILSLPRVPWRDDARIVGLLAEQSAGASTLHRQVAQLVHRMAVERIRQAKEDQRRAERLEATVREEQRKIEELQQKLGALRAIDRELRRRP